MESRAIHVVCRRPIIREKYLFPILHLYISPLECFLAALPWNELQDILDRSSSLLRSVATGKPVWREAHDIDAVVWAFITVSLVSLWLPLLGTSSSWVGPHPLLLLFHLTVSSWHFSTRIGTEAKGLVSKIVNSILLICLFCFGGQSPQLSILHCQGRWSHRVRN